MNIKLYEGMWLQTIKCLWTTDGKIFIPKKRFIQILGLPNRGSFVTFVGKVGIFPIKDISICTKVRL